MNAMIQNVALYRFFVGVALIQTLGRTNVSFAAGNVDDQYAGYSTGVSLLIDAVEASGFNPAIIDAGTIRADVHEVHRPPSEEEIREGIRNERRAIEQYLRELSETDIKNQELLTSQLKTLERDVRKNMIANSNRVIEYSWVFHGSDPYFIYHQEMHVTAERNNRQDDHSLIVTGGSSRQGDYAFITRRREEGVMKVVSRYQITPPNVFGRIEGELVRILVTAAGSNANQTSLVIPADERNRLESQDAKLRKDGAGSRFLGIKKLDGHTCIGLQLGSEASARMHKINAMEYWIDVGRGFLCPLMIERDSAGHIVRRISSDRYFVDSESGVWFPGEYQVTLFKNEEQMIDLAYSFDDDSVHLNHEVDKKYGAVEVRPGQSIIDHDGIQYRARIATSIPVTEGKIDLDRVAGLTPYGHSPPSLFRADHWLWFAIAGMITLTGAVIVWTIFVMVRRTRMNCRR